MGSAPGRTMTAVGGRFHPKGVTWERVTMDIAIYSI